MEDVETLTAQEVAQDLQDGTFQKWLNNLLPQFWSFLWCVILALIVYFIGTFIIRLLLKVIKKALRLHNCDDGVQQFLLSLVKYTLYALLFVVIVGLFGITTTSISAAVAAVGVTAGLALQGSLSNFAGGVLILIMRPFKVGDYIIEDSHKNEGTVTHISIIYTTLRTDNGNLVQIPNGTLSNSSLTNITSSGKRRVNERVGISYNADIKKAKEVLTKIVLDCQYRLADEAYTVCLAELADSSVQMGVMFFTAPENYWKAKFETLEKIKLCFDAEGIEICFNQLDVHIDGQVLGK